MKRKVLAQFLAMGLALTSLPASAYAAEVTDEVVIETESSSTDEKASVDEKEDAAEDAVVAEDSVIVEDTVVAEEEATEEDSAEVEEEATEEEKAISASKVTINDEDYYFVVNSDELSSDSIIVLESSEDESTEVTFADFIQIDDTDVFYYSTAKVSGKLYGTAVASYTDLYKGKTSAAEYDAVSSATTGKSGLFTSVNTSEVTDEGYSIYGLKNANIGISKEDYVKATILNAADKLDNEAYSNLLNVELNEDTTAPSYYIPYDGNSYGNVIIRKSISIHDASADLKYFTRYGTYQLEINEDSTNYLRKTRDNDLYAINNSVHGAIIHGTDANGNAISLGVRHLKELWVSTYEIAFSPDTNAAVSFEGGTITSVDYLTATDVYSYKFDEPVKVKATYDTSNLKTYFNENDKKLLTVSGFDSELSGATLSLSYKEGRQSVKVVDEAPVNVENGRIKHAVDEELIPEKEYTVTIVNDQYADIILTVTPETIDSDPEENVTPEEPVTPAEPSNPEEPAIEEPTEIDLPSFDSLTDEQKEYYGGIDEQIRSTVKNVVIPEIQKRNLDVKDVLNTVVKQLLTLQSQLYKMLFGK